MKRALIGALALALPGLVAAQVSVTNLNTPVTQDFNTLVTSGSTTWTNNATVPGWFHARTGTGTTIVANDGASNAGNLYSYGTGTNAERALGSIGSGNAAIGNLFWGVRLQNNTGAPITTLQVSYVGEQWRNSAAAAQTISFSYLVGSPTVTGSLAEFQTAGTAVPQLNFTSPVTGGTAAALDGNLPANRVAITHTITGLNIPVGAEVMLRWSDPDHTGADHGLAIDDVSVSARTSCPALISNTLSAADPTFNRMLGFNQGGSCTLSAVGTAVRFKAIPFDVPATANVTLSLVDADGASVTPTQADTFLALYPAGGFNPASPCANAIAANDDAVGVRSRIVTTTPLAPGGYIAVVTSFDNVPAGAGALPWTYSLVTSCPAVVTNADITVLLTDSPDPATAGSNYTYTATATNNGPDAANDVSLSLPLPATTTFVSVNGGAGASCTTPAVGANGTVSCTWAGATANGATRTMTVVAGVPANAGGATLNATLTGSTTSTDPTPANNTATTATSVIAAVDLSMALTDAPDPVTAGAGVNLVYTATLSNGGPSDAQNARFSLPLPAGVTFVSATPGAGGNCTGTTTVTCTWAGATAPAASRSATITVSVPASTPAGPVTATATATSDTNDGTPGNNTASTTTTIATSADLSITLTDNPDPVVAGTQLTYTATVTNGGPSDAQTVSFALPLAAGTSFVSAAPSAGGNCTNVSPITCTWAGATVPGASRSATITVLVAASVTQGTNLSATATASSATSDPQAGNNTATATTAVNAQADIAMTAFTDSPDPVVAGTNLTYQVAMINNGPSDAQNVRFSLPLPTGTSVVSATPSTGGSCTNVSPVTCTWAGATAPATSRSATIVVLVAPSVPQGTILNATVTGASDTTETAPGNNSLSTSAAVIAQADLQIGLTASVPTADLGQTVTFTATSTNLGPSDAQNVVLSITLSPDFRYGSFSASAGAVCTTPQIGNSGVISCTWAGATAPGVVRTLAVNAASFTPGTSSIQAATSSPTTDPVPQSNNVASVSVLVGNPIEPIPTLSQWGLVLLGLLVGLIGVAMVRRD